MNSILCTYRRTWAGLIIYYILYIYIFTILDLLTVGDEKMIGAKGEIKMTGIGFEFVGHFSNLRGGSNILVV